MYRNILLCTDGSASADIAGEYGRWLAKKLNARMQALYVTDLRVLQGSLLSDLSGALGAQPYTALLPLMEEIQKKKADTILSTVKQICEDQQIACEIVHETGLLMSILRKYEAATDLVVLGQRGEHAQWLEGMLGSNIERAVRTSINPCLVTPNVFHPIRHILLAYDGSAESNKALRVGIALAADLQTELTIVTVCQRETEDAASNVLQDAHRRASDRKLKAHAQLAHGNPEIEILSLCETVKADLIVMGAYGHTRIREWILGSTTSHVLRKACVPVLLARGA